VRSARGAAPPLLLLLAAGCAYVPTRLSLRAPSRALVGRAVADALAREFPGLEERDAEGGRFVSKPRPDPLDPRARLRGYVRLLPGRAEGAPFELEVSVARERLYPFPGKSPSWRAREADRRHEARLASEIERALSRLSTDGP
jgi:hypothetical protein